jgi:hypothetical protein
MSAPSSVWDIGNDEIDGIKEIILRGELWNAVAGWIFAN